MGERESGVSADEMPVRQILLASDARVPDFESLSWLRSLRTGPERDDAVCRLHGLLLRAARTEIARRAAAGAGLRDLDDLAVQAADDALVAVLGKLHTYKGPSVRTRRFASQTEHDPERSARLHARAGTANQSPRPTLAASTTPQWNERLAMPGVPGPHHEEFS
jgi:hypothetical protein